MSLSSFPIRLSTSFHRSLVATLIFSRFGLHLDCAGRHFTTLSQSDYLRTYMTLTVTILHLLPIQLFVGDFLSFQIGPSFLPLIVSLVLDFAKDRFELPLICW